MTECCRQPQQDHQVVAAKFDIVLDDASKQDIALNSAHAAIKRPPLSKFGIDASLSMVNLEEASKDGYWYRSGRFWNKPQTGLPVGEGPHVVAKFKPEPDLIDDIPYV